jgi:hypothetical protein
MDSKIGLEMEGKVLAWIMRDDRNVLRTDMLTILDNF